VFCYLDELPLKVVVGRVENNNSILRIGSCESIDGEQIAIVRDTLPQVQATVDRPSHCYHDFEHIVFDD